MNDLVSIITPSYNTASFIAKTIESVLHQTYTRWEMIIVDDCSTDNTDEIVKPFLSDKRIRYLKNDKNSGAAVSRNYALREAKGKWIAFLDSDDLWMPEKLAKQIAFMERNRYAFTCTDYNINLNGVWLPYVYTSPNIITKRKLYNYCYFSTITVIYDREKIGLIQIESIKKNNDYAMWLKVINKSDCHRYPECLSTYNKHEDSISSGSKIKLIKWHYILFRTVLNKGKVSAILLTLNNIFHGIIKKIVYKKKVEDQNHVVI